MNSHRSIDSNRVSGLNRCWIHCLTFKYSVPGKFPPLPPRSFFGRDELVKQIVDLAEDLTPIALIGAGGIGKTSIALTVLHHNRIKQRFGHDRRFIRCDQFPASCAHFLRRLSKVTGAGAENPEDLTPLYPFLSSKEMLIVLDNAESILDPQGADVREIYMVVEELSRFNNLCIFLTSRISTTPPDFMHLDVPTLPMDAACDTFYRIYGNDNRSDLVNDILKQLDFHPLSITLLGTVARQNKWDVKRLAKEWEERRTSVLETGHSNSLASTIELSLTSPLFRQLGPDARPLLEVIAFFPQGVDEKNLGWLFPAIPDTANIFDKFCALSLTYRNGGFVTMLAPLRDYLHPKDPTTSSLLRSVKEHYFTRMSVYFNPSDPGFVKTQWITSEDINVEHLLDVFTMVNPSSSVVWEACGKFMEHLYWHKVRLTVLGPRIEGLLDDHSSKLQCLFQLARLCDKVGNRVECKRLLAGTLRLCRECGSDMIAQVLRYLSDVNRRMGLCKEGIEQVEEALTIYEKRGDIIFRAECLNKLAFLFQADGQLDAAEEAASGAINLIGDKGNQLLLCGSHRVLGEIYNSKGEREKAISHFERALEIATPFGWHDQLFWTHYSLGLLFYDDGRFEDAQAHAERAKLFTANNPYVLARAMYMQARIWYRQHRLEEAKSEALRAADAFKKLGAAGDVESCSKLLRAIQKELDVPVLSG